MTGTKSFTDYLTEYTNGDTVFFVQVGFNRHRVINADIDPYTNAVLFHITEDAENPQVEMPDSSDIA